MISITTLVIIALHNHYINSDNFDFYNCDFDKAGKLYSRGDAGYCGLRFY